MKPSKYINRPPGATCPECNGHGERQVGYFWKGVVVDCEKCGGTGDNPDYKPSVKNPEEMQI
jgi:DnaJ-class molecular chaperone